MNALDKLEAVEISVDNRISETDRQFCEAHQTAYKEAKEMLSELKYIWEDTLNRQHQLLEPYETSKYTLDKYISIPNFSVKDIQQRLECIHRVFIENLVEHFNSVYNVSLDSKEIADILLPNKPERYYPSDSTEAAKQYQQQLKTLMVDYKDVLDRILIQLGGRTFHERALDELKEKCHKAAWNTYHGKAEYELKNDTIRFAYGCSFKDWVDKWEVNDSLKEILRGLSYFETGIFGAYPSGISRLLGWDRMEYPLVEFSGCTKLQSLRMFKNGRTDVKFRSRVYARQFVTQFLGLAC